MAKTFDSAYRFGYMVFVRCRIIGFGPKDAKSLNTMEVEFIDGGIKWVSGADVFLSAEERLERGWIEKRVGR